MTIFVSYSRRDNDDRKLRELQLLLAELGDVYIDDLHHIGSNDRSRAVYRALYTADRFISVISDNYLRTPWTTKEFRIARERGIAMFSLLPDGTMLAIPADKVILASAAAVS